MIHFANLTTLNSPNSPTGMQVWLFINNLHLDGTGVNNMLHSLSLKITSSSQDCQIGRKYSINKFSLVYISRNNLAD